MSPDRRLAGLARLGESLLPPCVAIGVSGYADPGILDPVELEGIARAVPSRQREFAGGRAAAALAQHRLRGRSDPLPMGPDRAPLWPQGLRGSITHTAGLCLAAVANKSEVVGLGVDLEVDEPLPPEILAEITFAGDDPSDPKLLFSARESVFKALYPQVGAVFGFDAVRVQISEGIFDAVLNAPLGPYPAGLRLSGRFGRFDGLILTALAI